MKSSQRIKWNIFAYPVMKHFIVACNNNNEIKLFKADHILSVSMTNRIVKALEKGWA